MEALVAVAVDAERSVVLEIPHQLLQARVITVVQAEVTVLGVVVAQESQVLRLEMQGATAEMELHQALAAAAYLTAVAVVVVAAYRDRSLG